MDFPLAVLAVIIGYLVGSLSFARVVTRFFSPKTNLDDIAIKDEITGEQYRRRPSASSVSMALGWKAGCLVSLLDMLKVSLPVLAFQRLLPGQPYFLLVAAFAVVGHNWPVYYRFRGGGGISAIYGGLLVIDPLAIIVSSLAGLVIGLLLLRRYLVMFLLSLLFIIPWMAWRFDDPAYWIYAAGVNVLYLIVLVSDTLPYLRPGARVMSEHEVMQQLPMGRGMIKMMDIFRAQKTK